MGFRVVVFVSLLGVACSAERMETGKYSIRSNCPNAKTEGSIELKQKTTYSTIAYDYEAEGAIEYGLASNFITRDGSTLTSFSSTRNCSGVAAGEKVKEVIFICRDLATQEAICTVFLGAG